MTLKIPLMLEKAFTGVELKQFYKEDWDKIHPQRCEKLIASNHKCLIAVVAAKGGTTSY